MDASYAVQEDVAKLSVLDDLDRELSRLEEIGNVLSARLSPISNRYAVAEMLKSPAPEPSSEIRGRIDRLRDIAATFDRIIQDIDL